MCRHISSLWYFSFFLLFVFLLTHLQLSRYTTMRLPPPLPPSQYINVSKYVHSTSNDHGNSTGIFFVLSICYSTNSYYRQCHVTTTTFENNPTVTPIPQGSRQALVCFLPPPESQRQGSRHICVSSPGTFLFFIFFLLY